MSLSSANFLGKLLHIILTAFEFSSIAVAGAMAAAVAAAAAAAAAVAAAAWWSHEK